MTWSFSVVFNIILFYILIAILLIRSHVQHSVMYMHLKLLCDVKPNFIVLIVKVGKLIKLVQNKKTASVGNRTQNVSVTAHHLYHRPKDDSPETHLLIYHKVIRYYIGDLFKSQFESLVFYL